MFGAEIGLQDLETKLKVRAFALGAAGPLALTSWGREGLHFKLTIQDVYLRPLAVVRANGKMLKRLDQ